MVQNNAFILSFIVSYLRKPFYKLIRAFSYYL